MPDLQLTHHLVGNGVPTAEILRLVRNGELRRVRRGAYAATAHSDPAVEHRRLVQASLAQGHPGAVVSHVSAAVLHGLPVRQALLERVHLTRARVGGGQQRRWVQVHGARLEPADVTTVDDVSVTSPARTVVDLGCSLPPRDSVPAGDAALRLGADPAVIGAALDRAGPRHGIAAARRAVALLDARSESHGESVSRVLLHEHGFADPVLQLDVFDAAGVFVARSDFGWPALGVLGEFDGRVKYGRELHPDGDLEDVLFAEKLREDAVRDLGWQVARWTFRDLVEPAAWLARLGRAAARGRSAPPPRGSSAPAPATRLTTAPGSAFARLPRVRA